MWYQIIILLTQVTGDTASIVTLCWISHRSWDRNNRCGTTIQPQLGAATLIPCSVSRPRCTQQIRSLAKSRGPRQGFRWVHWPCMVGFVQLCLSSWMDSFKVKKNRMKNFAVPQIFLKIITKRIIREGNTWPWTHNSSDHDSFEKLTWRAEG